MSKACDKNSFNEKSPHVRWQHPPMQMGCRPYEDSVEAQRLLIRPQRREAGELDAASHLGKKAVA